MQLHVKNQGAEVPRDILMSMFEPLHRMQHGSKSEERSNLGLGLFIVREVAHAHGGTVDVEVDDCTTEFVVNLPTPTAT